MNTMWNVWFEEDQRNPNFDDDGCEIYAFQKSFDVQMDALMLSFPQAVRTQIASMGYMAEGLDGALHFHSSPRYLECLTGNGIKGNSVDDAVNAFKKYGTVPWTDLPFTPVMTQAEYFAPIPAAEITKGQQFLALIGGEKTVSYSWLWKNAAKNLQLAAQKISQAPLILGIAVDAGWNQGVPVDPLALQAVQHAVLCYDVENPLMLVSDNYAPFEKTLDAGYPIPYCALMKVTPVFEVVQEATQIVQTAEQIVPQVPVAQQLTILTAIQNLLLSLLHWMKN